MSRGDKRDRDRAKAQAKNAEKQKAQAKGGDPLKRNENDAAALQAKVAAKKAAKDSADNAGPEPKGPVARKKVPTKKADNMDDLLSAGLAGNKKRVK